MAEPDNGNVATEDALQQVQALKDRINQSAVATEEANRRAAAAEGTAAVAIDAANRAAAAVEQVTTTSRVSTELDAANREMDEHKRAYKDAFTAGDADAMAEAQAKIGRAAAKIDRLEIAKDAPPVRPTQPDAMPRRPAAPISPERYADLARNGFVGASPSEQEMFIAERQSSATAAWLRQHPQFFSDPKFNRTVRAADVEWDGAKDTPEYFAFVERKLGLTQEPAQDPPAARAGSARTEKSAADTGTAGAAATLTPAGMPGANADLPAGRRGPPQAGRQRQAPVAAPPNRDGAPNLGGRGNSGEKRITPEMQAWARMMYPPTKDHPDGGIDPEQYYDEYMRLKEEGEIGDRFGRG